MSTAFLVMAGVTVAAEGLAVAWLVDNARFNRAQHRARLAHRLTGQLQRGWSGWVFGTEPESLTPAVTFTVPRQERDQDHGQDHGDAGDAGDGARVLVLPADTAQQSHRVDQGRARGAGQGGGTR